jgi:hypothetical protein
MTFYFSLSVDYIMKLSISSLYSEDDRMANEYGAAGKMRLVGKAEVLGENLPQFHSVHHRSKEISPEFEPGPGRCEAGD